MRTLAYLCFFLFLSAAIAQTPVSLTDSLISLLKTDKEDTTKAKHLNELGWELKYIKPDTSIITGIQSLKLAEKLNWKKGISKALSHIGSFYYIKSDYPNALDYYTKGLRMDESESNRAGIATALGSIGLVYADQSDYPRALEYYFKALKMDEELGNKFGVASHLGNIGIVYKEQSDYPKALEYLLKGLKLAEDLKDKSLQANALSNIGSVYYLQKNIPKGLDYYFKTLKIDEELGNKYGVASDLGNIGSVYKDQLDYPRALDCYLKTLKIADELGIDQLQANTLGDIGMLYTKTGKFIEAEEKLKKAIAKDSAIGALNYLWQYEYYLSELYDTTGRYKLALNYYKKAMVLKDTVYTQEKNKDMTRREMNYEFSKKEAIAEAQKKKQRIIIWSVLIGLVLVAIVLLIVFRSLQVTRRQKTIIEKQKAEVDKQRLIVEEHQKEILDSITYAKRLQQAILPGLDEIKKQFPQSFLLYKPKDIVAGDFYWMESFDDTLFIAAADSTGHGVPGAMVSVVCSNALNRAVNEFHLRDTGKILDKTRELVLETFAKSSTDVKDGMDISLLRVRKNRNPGIKEELREVQWSGANNPLLYIDNRAANPKTEVSANAILKEIKPDKQPIGKTDNPTSFTTHTVACNPDTIFYLLTDGYADQFGGPQGKKFKYKQLKEKLIENSGKSLEDQNEVLSKSFDQWKGNLEQIDDVTVIGIML